MVTNLNKDEYNDLNIKNIYLSRWDIEVFFKFIKSNFKFSNLKEHNKKTLNQYKKMYYMILTLTYISRMIENVYEKNVCKIHKYKFKKENKNKYAIKYNKSLMIDGLKNIINNIIKSNINPKLLKKYSNHFLVTTNIQINVYK